MTPHSLEIKEQQSAACSWYNSTRYNSETPQSKSSVDSDSWASSGNKVYFLSAAHQNSCLPSQELEELFSPKFWQSGAPDSRLKGTTNSCLSVRPALKIPTGFNHCCCTQDTTAELWNTSTRLCSSMSAVQSRLFRPLNRLPLCLMERKELCLKSSKQLKKSNLSPPTSVQSHLTVSGPPTQRAERD